MSEKENSVNRLYVYCLTKEPVPSCPDIVSIDGDEEKVFSIIYKDVSVFVSKAKSEKYIADRKNTITHEKILESVMLTHDIIPMRFATVVDGENELQKFIDDNQGAINDVYEKIRNKQELGLKVLIKMDEMMKKIINEYSAIRKMRDKIASIPLEKSYYERIEIGKMVADALEKEKTKYRDLILEALSPLAEEVIDNKSFGEMMLMNTAFLVDKAKEKEFDEQVNQLAENIGDSMKFKYVGNLPPYNFVNLSL